MGLFDHVPIWAVELALSLTKVAASLLTARNNEERKEALFQGAEALKVAEDQAKFPNG